MMSINLKNFSSPNGGKFNDFKVTPIWAVVTIVFTLAILINSGILIYYSRLLSIQEDANKLYKEELKTKQDIYLNGLDVSNEQYAEAFLKSILSESKLRNLAKTYWSYELDADNKKITSTDFTITKQGAVFALKQIEKERILPYNLHILGSLTAGDKADKFYEHPMFNSTSNVTITPPLANNNPAIALYEFKDAKPGDTIIISLTPPLQERLGLSASQIKVKIK